jgi:hypothetical protein
VLLQFVDPNVLSDDEDLDAPLEEGEVRETPLRELADKADPSDYSTHVNQLILAKQLIKHGANVNAVSSPQGETPLYSACDSDIVTNLDFIELLLVEGANPNAPARSGVTPLMGTPAFAPGAAKFLLNWPTTDFNISTRAGECYLVTVRYLITSLCDQIAFPDNPDQLEQQFLLQQWREIEEMLVERGT